MNASPILRIDLDMRDSIWRRLKPEALVMQEDRYLQLGSLPAVDLDPRDDLDSAYLAIRKRRPLPLGRYLVLRPGEGRPGWIYQAVVHEIGSNPSCCCGDVRKALVAVLLDARNRGINFLACEPLGFLGDDGLSMEELIEAVDAAVLELCSELEEPVRLVLLFDSVKHLEEASNRLRSRVMLRANRSLRNVSGDSAMVEIKRDAARLRFSFVPGSLSGYQVARVGRTAPSSTKAPTGIGVGEEKSDGLERVFPKLPKDPVD